MAQLQERLTKFEQERKEIHKKMLPLKSELKPLSVRLLQVTRNINTIKSTMKSAKV